MTGKKQPQEPYPRRIPFTPFQKSTKILPIGHPRGSSARNVWLAALHGLLQCPIVVDL